MTSTSISLASTAHSSAVLFRIGGPPAARVFVIRDFKISASVERGNVPVLSTIDALVVVGPDDSDRWEIRTEARKLSEIYHVH